MKPVEVQFIKPHSDLRVFESRGSIEIFWIKTFNMIAEYSTATDVKKIAGFFEEKACKDRTD